MAKKKKRTEYEYYAAEEEVYYRKGPGWWMLPFSALKGLFGGMGWLVRGMWRGMWATTSAVLGWSWRAVKATWHFNGSVINWTLGLTGSILKSIWYFIVGAPVPDLPEFDEFGNPNVKAIRAHMKRRYGRRYRMAAHVVIFLFSMAAVWIDFLWNVQQYNEFGSRYASYPPHAGGQLTFTGIWVLFLILHFIRFSMSNAEDKAVEQELERRLGRKPYDPAFYERQMRLSDDGELVYGDELVDEKRKLQHVE